MFITNLNDAGYSENLPLGKIENNIIPLSLTSVTIIEGIQKLNFVSSNKINKAIEKVNMVMVAKCLKKQRS